MIHLFTHKLNLNKFSTETPYYEEYARIIYSNVIQSDYLEEKSLLPKTYDDLVVQIKNDFENLKAESSNRFDINKQLVTITELVEIFDDIKNFMLIGDIDMLVLLRIILAHQIHFLTAVSLQNKKIIHTREDLMYFAENRIQFSQRDIANEWQVDNDTLSKWFIIKNLENPFFKRKKINLSEYLQIFNDFFILQKHKDNNENFMMPIEAMDFYNSLALKGKTYSKKDIIEHGFNLDDEVKPRMYSQALRIPSSKFPYYKNLNKFPASIAFELIDELKNYS